MHLHSSPKKQLVLQKISLNDDDKRLYKTHLDKIFSQPEFYFNSTFNDREVVIGKRFTTRQLNVPQHIKSRKSILQLRNLKNIASQNSSKSMYKINNAGDNKSNGTTSKNVILPSNKRTIEESELKDIFDKYKEIKTENTIEHTKHNEVINDKMFEVYNKTTRKEMKRILHSQEKALQRQHNLVNEVNYISKGVSTKINRPIDELLMTSTEKFRVKKELKDIFSKEIQARNPKPIQNWVLTLRDNNSKHYINFGSIKNPKWQMIVSPKLPKETIRNPNLLIDYNNTDFNFFSKDEYLKHKISNSTYSTLNQDMARTTNGFNMMRVKCQDLLQFEIDNAKAIKGRKVITQSKTEGLLPYVMDKIRDINNNTQNETIVDDVNYKELLRKKGRMNVL